MSVFKITIKGKPPQMLSLACKLTKNDVEFLHVEISLEKVRANNVDSSTIKITWKKSKWKQRGCFVRKNCTEKIAWKQRRFSDHGNYIEKSTVEEKWIFRPAKLRQEWYVEITWIFQPAKLR